MRELNGMNDMRMRLRSIRRSARIAPTISLLLIAVNAGAQQSPSAPATTVATVRLVPADHIRLPGDVDSNSPIVWAHDDGRAVMFSITSIDGRPSLAAGRNLGVLGAPASMAFEQW